MKSKQPHARALRKGRVSEPYIPGHYGNSPTQTHVFRLELWTPARAGAQEGKPTRDNLGICNHAGSPPLAFTARTRDEFECGNANNENC